MIRSYRRSDECEQLHLTVPTASRTVLARNRPSVTGNVGAMASSIGTDINKAVQPGTRSGGVPNQPYRRVRSRRPGSPGGLAVPISSSKRYRSKGQSELLTTLMAQRSESSMQSHQRASVDFQSFKRLALLHCRATGVLGRHKA